MISFFQPRHIQRTKTIDMKEIIMYLLNLKTEKFFLQTTSLVSDCYNKVNAVMKMYLILIQIQFVKHYTSISHN